MFLGKVCGTGLESLLVWQNPHEYCLFLGFYEEHDFVGLELNFRCEFGFESGLRIKTVNTRNSMGKQYV